MPSARMYPTNVEQDRRRAIKEFSRKVTLPNPAGRFRPARHIHIWDKSSVDAVGRVSCQIARERE